MAAANLFSALAARRELWANHDPDRTSLLNVFGADAATSHTAAKTAILATAVNSPTFFSFGLVNDPNFIYIGYHPTAYPNDITSLSVYDNQVTMLVGDDLDACSMVALPMEAFGRVAAVRTRRLDYITGAEGHGAATPVFRFAIPDAGEEHDLIRDRRVHLLPTGFATAALADYPAGRIPLLAFYNALAGYLGGSADRAALIAPTVHWYRLYVTDAATTGSVLQVPGTAATLPHDQQAGNRHKNRVASELSAKLGIGGPNLSTHAFTQGIMNLGNTLTNNANAQVAYLRDRDNKTFTTRHGDALAQRMHQWCNAATDADLPEIHQLTAKANKGRDYAIVSSQIQARVQASSVPLTLATAPLATTKLMDDVFRSFQISGSGAEFATFLSPFAVVCTGHDDHQALQSLVRQAELAEQGGAMSLQDARRLISTDVRFPTTPQVAAEKCYGWSILIDLFHGSNHAVATCVRNFVNRAGPSFHRVASLHLDNPKLGMDLVCRVLFDAQQEYFTWANAAALAPDVPSANAIGLPNFASLTNKLDTHRVESLSALPAIWYAKFGTPKGARSNANDGESPTRNQSGTAAVHNAHTDARLKRRFEQSNFSSITAMIEAGGDDVDIPKVENKPVCLVWALKGTCTRNCKRKDQHVRYERSVINGIHSLMDSCGVETSN